MDSEPPMDMPTCPYRGRGKENLLTQPGKTWASGPSPLLMPGDLCTGSAFLPPRQLQHWPQEGGPRFLAEPYIHMWPDSTGHLQEPHQEDTGSKVCPGQPL
jgi:hypothetical protein